MIVACRLPYWLQGLHCGSSSAYKNMTPCFCTQVVSPWGEVVAKAETDEQIICADIDLDYVQQVRKQIPIHLQRREDIYQLENISKAP